MNALAFLTSPALLLGNFSYLLMASSVLMRDIAWLRALAIAGGSVKIVYRTWFVFDPTSIVWEAMFVVINIAQLLIAWRASQRPIFHVRHMSREAHSPYRLGQPGNDFKPQVAPLSHERVIEKNTNSAFIA